MRYTCIQIARQSVIACFAIVLMLSIKVEVFGQAAEQLLRQAGSYQAADDTSDRASELYRQLIETYPKSREAESAQFSLGGYYTRKFFLLEERNNVQDWDSFNKAEEALKGYRITYPRGTYLADSYHNSALIALRRGDTKTAFSLWTQMKDSAQNDRKVYIYRLPWSTGSYDVIKGYCDTEILAQVSLDAMGRQPSFHYVVNELTNWSRQNCVGITQIDVMKLPVVTKKQKRRN